MPLADADQLVRMICDLRIAAVLHGHRHCAFRVDLPAPPGPTPVLCAGLGDAQSPTSRSAGRALTCTTSTAAAARRAGDRRWHA